MSSFKTNTPILKAASIQVTLVGICSLILIVAFSFINTSESLKKIRSIYEPLKGEINSEVFINNTTNAKNDSELYSIRNLKSQIRSNDVQASLLVGSCGSKADLEFAINSVDEMNKCVLINLKDHSIVSSVKNIALAIILLIILSLPIYHFAFKESVKSERFQARSDLADEVLHGVGSPLARLELALSAMKENRQSEDLKVVESVYEDFKYQFLKLSYDETKEDELIKTDLNSLIELVLRTKKKELIESKKDIAINFNKKNEGFFTFANPKVLREILDNIINNALHAVKNSGAINIELVNDNESLKLRITDNGEGIRPENLEKIFEKGFSTKSKEKASGLGLGLYQTKRELERLGGSIQIDSKRGNGTKVTITLKPFQNDLATISDKNKIIMIDDDSFLLKTAMKSFVQIGYEVEIFGSPESVITKMNQLDKSSIVLYDMNFENSSMDGLQLREKFIEAGFQPSRLVLISSLADKISARTYEKILSVSKSNFNEIITTVKRMSYE